MKRLILGLSMAVVLMACSSTIRVKDTSNGGQITMMGGRGETMDLAKPVMAAKCGGPSGYDVTEDSGADAHPTDQGEWQLTYRCRSGAQEAKPAETTQVPAAPPPQS